MELLRNLPLYGGRFDSPLIRDLESRRDVLTGQSTGYANSKQEDPGGCSAAGFSLSPIYGLLILWRPQVGKTPDSPWFSWLLALKFMDFDGS